MLTYRKKHLCMSLKSQLCEVENRCRCFPTTLTTAPLLSSALSHCHRAACVSLHFLTLCCAVFRAITFSCIKQNMIHLHIYISQTAKLSAALISGLHLTALYAYCTGMPAVILHELVSLFFFFQMGNVSIWNWRLNISPLVYFFWKWRQCWVRPF